MKQGPERELMARYLGRAVASGKALGLTGFSVTELTESRAGAAGARKAEEARTLAAALPADGMVVALDEHGKSVGSEEFARRIGHWRDDGKAVLSFVIGGADGLGSEVLSRADLTLGFSAMTWPHQLVRIMLAEQLYRATTILSGHPYHRE